MSSVHSSHCCVLHGCKYGEESCPVVIKTEAQEYPCEWCHEEGFEEAPTIESINVQEVRFSANVYSSAIAYKDGNGWHIKSSPEWKEVEKLYQLASKNLYG